MRGVRLATIVGLLSSLGLAAGACGDQGAVRAPPPVVADPLDGGAASPAEAMPSSEGAGSTTAAGPVAEATPPTLPEPVPEPVPEPGADTDGEPSSLRPEEGLAFAEVEPGRSAESDTGAPPPPEAITEPPAALPTTTDRPEDAGMKARGKDDHAVERMPTPEEQAAFEANMKAWAEAEAAKQERLDRARANRDSYKSNKPPTGKL